MNLGTIVGGLGTIAGVLLLIDGNWLIGAAGTVASLAVLSWGVQAARKPR